MVDVPNSLKWVAAIVLLGIVYLLVSSGDILEQVFALILVAAGIWLYIRDQRARQVIDPVATVMRQLTALCYLNRNPYLRDLKLAGGDGSPALMKGRIIGGPVNYLNRRLLFKSEKTIGVDGDEAERKVNFKPEDFRVEFDEDGFAKLDPAATGYVLLYSMHYGMPWDWPVIGGVLKTLFRDEHLICIYPHQLESKVMVGDVRIVGVSTRFAGTEELEFVNDWTMNYKREMKRLEDEVDTITLTENLRDLPARIKNAIDSSPDHRKTMEQKDDVQP